MKKFGAIMMIALLMLSIEGCETKDEVVKKEEVQTQSEQNIKGENIIAVEGEDSLEVEKNLFSVEITLPAAYAGDLTEFDEAAYLKENQGIKEARVLEDGSLFLKMSKKKHDELIGDTRTSMEEAFRELLKDPETPYLKEISWSKDFQDFTIVVNGEAWENAFDVTPFTLAISTAMYQSIKGDDFQTTIKIVDEESKEVLQETIFPDDLMED